MVPTPHCIDHLETQPAAWVIFLSSIALFSIFNNCMLILQWLYRTFIRPPKDLKTYGTWALVTGSTDGIGLAFAFKLAEKGLNLVLVSRNPSRLKQISGEIHARYPEVEVKILDLEFSSDLAVSRVNGELKEMIQGLDIGVLINNVGITYPGAMYFHEVGEDIWMNLIKVNVLGTSHVTRAVLRGMIRRGRGAIINIGSGAAIVVPSHPLYAIYAASKA
ncbi:short-chain dehydrogenase/reductase family protein [Dorcoceras hygrometricum]|uniref:Short-chain dehydrogenase/reductase family protein n=1 Tax=Dorcoceras hygrometricum TaxID=472368 RepID=A0A2Z7A7X7_9LAMI|nr:short-chain dehydrogenase/reductase family protein [Dorcoceras hygrometricum]